MRRVVIVLLSLMLSLPAVAASEKAKGPALDGMSLRGIGPAITSGRIADLAVNPENPAEIWLAFASGGVWRTRDHGISWKPVFDRQGSYSIGVVTLDPNDPMTVWVGTGENNSQRSVSYGDGVYKSTDGGETWQNMGLKDSEHIGKILVDPRDSNVIYVAAQGPLWRDGGDRGLYKSTDGGKNWEKILEISDKTGINEVVFEPGNPDVLYASAYQRRRHTWVLIDGGPESGIYKSTDAGKSWKKLKRGLPKGDMGKIGLAVSPVAPKTVYAIIEALGEENGFYRSTNGGASWKKMSGYMSSSPQYYNEIFADPKREDRVYSMDTFLHATDDGGKHFYTFNEDFKHVDNHALWIDPNNTDHLLVGCDGGLYETWDRGQAWRFYANLPTVQFYRGTPDNAFPFYNVYGGTQDNNSIGGPVRTATEHGIRNSDWFITLGGDGFKTQIDPKDPNIVYSQLQYGVLVRHDRRTGEKIGIQPQEGKGEPALRWNWDSPLIISPHNHKRLYFGANILFRSDDQGNSWQAVSPDLTRNLDRNQLKVMGRIWSVDTVAKNASTSHFGNLFALDESPLVEGLLYAGSDDGVFSVSEDGGKHWRRLEKIKGVPEMSYVADIAASLHDPDTVYVAFRNHKKGDFKPYLMVSHDRGRHFKSIVGNLPQRGSVHSIAQDHVQPELLFVGTEFGLYFSQNGGKQWHALKGNLPVIAVRDVEIQRRENDLVLATFGRGFYILDDYSPLRTPLAQWDDRPLTLFPVKDNWMFIPESPLGGEGKSNQGEAFFTAPNPPYGAVFQYYVAQPPKSLKQQRQEKEKPLKQAGKDTPYPSWEALKKEKDEEKPAIIAVVRDVEGHLVRRLKAPAGKGFHRLAWDHRYPPASPARIKPFKRKNKYQSVPRGPLAAPGEYSVRFYLRQNGQLTALSEPETFHARALPVAGIEESDRKALLSFERKVARLQGAVLGADRSVKEQLEKVRYLIAALDATPAENEALQQEARAIRAELRALKRALRGDDVKAALNEAVPPGIIGRVQTVVYGLWDSTSLPTRTMRDQVKIAAELFQPVRQKLKVLVEQRIQPLEQQLDALGAPWTPGRLPR